MPWATRAKSLARIVTLWQFSRWIASTSAPRSLNVRFWMTRLSQFPVLRIAPEFGRLRNATDHGFEVVVVGGGGAGAGIDVRGQIDTRAPAGL